VTLQHSRHGNDVYDRDWKRLRNAFIRSNPLCVECEKDNKIIEATDVDHITPIAIAPHRRLDSTNLQSLCHSCHSKKTSQETNFGKYDQ
jgi:5-methylcytosine-specific restriction protein A